MLLLLLLLLLLLVVLLQTKGGVCGCAAASVGTCLGTTRLGAPLEWETAPYVGLRQGR